jgi:hypothetical protein
MTAWNLEEFARNRTEKLKATEAKTVKVVVPERPLLEDSI